MSEQVNPNQAAIDLLDSWLAKPPMRELTRREWYWWAGRHGGISRFLLPTIALCTEGYHRHKSLMLSWWAWSICFGYEVVVYATEPIEKPSS